MKNIVLCGVLAITLMTATGSAHSQSDACRFIEWGFGYMKVESLGESWTYSLKISGPHWRTERYGYHAPGTLSCVDGCGKGGAGGLYHFLAEPSSAQRPATAIERVKRNREEFSYPPITLNSDRLQHRTSTEAIRVGPLLGYAIAYRFTNPTPPREGNLLVISLTDNCVSFEASIARETRSDESDEAILNSLLAEIQISKNRSLANDTSANPIVRSRKEGEKPLFLHEILPSRTK